MPRMAVGKSDADTQFLADLARALARQAAAAAWQAQLTDTVNMPAELLPTSSSRCRRGGRIN